MRTVGRLNPDGTGDVVPETERSRQPADVQPFTARRFQIGGYPGRRETALPDPSVIATPPITWPTSVPAAMARLMVASIVGRPTPLATMSGGGPSRSPWMMAASATRSRCGTQKGSVNGGRPEAPRQGVCGWSLCLTAVVFVDLPRFAAWRFLHAVNGFEVVYAQPGILRGHTTAVENGRPYAVRYQITLDDRWRTREAYVASDTVAGPRETILRSDGTGRWTVNGEYAPQLDGLIDVDLEAPPARIPCRSIA